MRKMIEAQTRQSGARMLFSCGFDSLPSELGVWHCRATREAGSFDLLFIGLAADGRQVRSSVKGTRDPGYGCTSMMLAETALCLLDADDVLPGMWLPGAALQQRLIDRLEGRAGMRFTDETQAA